jgi:hypothetical protein
MRLGLGLGLVLGLVWALGLVLGLVLGLGLVLEVQSLTLPPPSIFTLILTLTPTLKVLCPNRPVSLSSSSDDKDRGREDKVGDRDIE